MAGTVDKATYADGTVVNQHEKPPGLVQTFIKMHCSPGDNVLVIGAGAGGDVEGVIEARCNCICIEKDDKQYAALRGRMMSLKMRFETKPASHVDIPFEKADASSSSSSSSSSNSSGDPKVAVVPSHKDIPFKKVARSEGGRGVLPPPVSDTPVTPVTEEKGPEPPVSTEETKTDPLVNTGTLFIAYLCYFNTSFIRFLAHAHPRLESHMYMLFFTENTGKDKTTDKEVAPTVELCKACKKPKNVVHQECSICNHKGRTCCFTQRVDPTDENLELHACSAKCMDQLLEELE
jgi:hypothetical protein